MPQRMLHESTSSGQRADTGLTVSAAPREAKCFACPRPKRYARQPRLQGTGRMHRRPVPVADHNLPASSTSSESADSSVFVAPGKTTVLLERQRKPVESLARGMTLR
jgi:hypothetical protein